jgi:predicted metal-binding protein
MQLFASQNSQNQFNFFVAKTCRDSLHNKIARYISAVRNLTSQICILLRWMTKEKFTYSDYPLVYHVIIGNALWLII